MLAADDRAGSADLAQSGDDDSQIALGVLTDVAGVGGHGVQREDTGIGLLGLVDCRVLALTKTDRRAS